MEGKKCFSFLFFKSTFVTGGEHFASEFRGGVTQRGNEGCCQGPGMFRLWS